MVEMHPGIAEIFGIALGKIGEGYRMDIILLQQQALQVIETERQTECQRIMQLADQAWDRESQNLSAQIQHYQEEVLKLGEQLNTLQNYHRLQSNQQILEFDCRISALQSEKAEADLKAMTLEIKCKHLDDEIKKADGNLRNKKTEHRIKMIDLKNELCAEQLAFKSSDEQVRMKNAEIERLKALVANYERGRGNGLRTSSMPINATNNDATPFSGAQVPVSKTRRDVSNSGLTEQDIITLGRKGFLLDLTKSVRDLEFNTFISNQQKHPTVDDEEDTKTAAMRRGEDVLDLEVIIRKLERDQYPSVSSVETDFKKVIDQLVLHSRTCPVDRQKRGLELFYAWKTKIARLPAMN